MIRCNRCNAANADHAAFCERCGNPLQVQQKDSGIVCHKCGKISFGNTRYCLNCGVYLYTSQAVEYDEDDEEEYEESGISAVTIIALILVAIIAISAYPIYKFTKEDVAKIKKVTETDLVTQFVESDHGEIQEKQYGDFDQDGNMEMFVTTISEKDSEYFDLWFVAEGQEVQKVTAKTPGRIQKLVTSGNHTFIVWKWPDTVSVSCYTVDGYACIGPVEPMYPSSVEQGSGDTVLIEGVSMTYNATSRKFE